MLKILTVPNQVLTTPTKPVTRVDGKIRRLVTEMEETLIHQTDPEGVGLAAPQVGVGLSLFIIKSSPKAPTEVFINPRIITTIEEKSPDEKPKKKQTKMEGCLSIPRIWAPLRRQRDIVVEFLDINGETRTETFKGFKSTIVQHEIDHLNGILFTMRCLEQGSDIYEEHGDRLEKIKNL
ncbi:peptide deformylase [Candidatus Microgenomates bacterium]|nr:peptide deformylase [Candidatus Microgenomates bacterium]